MIMYYRISKYPDGHGSVHLSDGVRDLGLVALFRTLEELEDIKGEISTKSTTPIEWMEEEYASSNS